MKGCSDFLSVKRILSLVLVSLLISPGISLADTPRTKPTLKPKEPTAEFLQSLSIKLKEKGFIEKTGDLLLTGLGQTPVPVRRGNDEQAQRAAFQRVWNAVSEKDFLEAQNDPSKWNPVLDKASKSVLGVNVDEFIDLVNQTKATTFGGDETLLDKRVAGALVSDANVLQHLLAKCPSSSYDDSFSDRAVPFCSAQESTSPMSGITKLNLDPRSKAELFSPRAEEEAKENSPAKDVKDMIEPLATANEKREKDYLAAHQKYYAELEAFQKNGGTPPQEPILPTPVYIQAPNENHYRNKVQKMESGMLKELPAPQKQRQLLWENYAVGSAMFGGLAQQHLTDLAALYQYSNEEFTVPQCIQNGILKDFPKVKEKIDAASKDHDKNTVNGPGYAKNIHALHNEVLANLRDLWKAEKDLSIPDELDGFSSFRQRAYDEVLNRVGGLFHDDEFRSALAPLRDYYFRYVGTDATKLGDARDIPKTIEDTVKHNVFYSSLLTEFYAQKNGTPADAVKRMHQALQRLKSYDEARARMKGEDKSPEYIDNFLFEKLKNSGLLSDLDNAKDSLTQGMIIVEPAKKAAYDKDPFAHKLGQLSDTYANLAVYEATNKAIKKAIEAKKRKMEEDLCERYNDVPDWFSDDQFVGSLLNTLPSGFNHQAICRLAMIPHEKQIRAAEIGIATGAGIAVVAAGVGAVATPLWALGVDMGIGGLFAGMSLHELSKARKEKIKTKEEVLGDALKPGEDYSARVRAAEDEVTKAGIMTAIAIATVGLPVTSGVRMARTAAREGKAAAEVAAARAAAEAAREAQAITRAESIRNGIRQRLAVASRHEGLRETIGHDPGIIERMQAIIDSADDPRIALATLHSDSNYKRVLDTFEHDVSQARVASSAAPAASSRWAAMSLPQNRTYRVLFAERDLPTPNSFAWGGRYSSHSGGTATVAPSERAIVFLYPQKQSKSVQVVGRDGRVILRISKKKADAFQKLLRESSDGNVDLTRLRTTNAAGWTDDELTTIHRFVNEIEMLPVARASTIVGAAPAAPPPASPVATPNPAVIPPAAPAPAQSVAPAATVVRTPASNIPLPRDQTYRRLFTEQDLPNNSFAWGGRYSSHSGGTATVAPSERAIVFLYPQKQSKSVQVVGRDGRVILRISKKKADAFQKLLRESSDGNVDLTRLRTTNAAGWTDDELTTIHRFVNEIEMLPVARASTIAGAAPAAPAPAAQAPLSTARTAREPGEISFQFSRGQSGGRFNIVTVRPPGADSLKAERFVFAEDKNATLTGDFGDYTFVFRSLTRNGAAPTDVGQWLQDGFIRLVERPTSVANIGGSGTSIVRRNIPSELTRLRRVSTFSPEASARAGIQRQVEEILRYIDENPAVRDSLSRTPEGQQVLGRLRFIKAN